ncbi:Asp23/Gls24 family envelope stress response protein [Sciscionella sediminilitoris]|uniref:Asp23/Gls24 family envelope stress response protein n=1 Tax=Sciscionella sediminilitoris TaxID=1445613 RepID=UPI0004DF8764|nr:Asp23/Gls24 family envelope stress response protein [Sciscionella sp. SE31]
MTTQETKAADPKTGENADRAPGEGTTSIADTVVEKIAGVAAREVSGIHDLGGGAARAIGAIRDRIPGTGPSAGQGVSVEVGEKQAAVDLQIVVEYGVSIADLTKAVRRNVITAIEQMTGLEVVEVNIAVNDVYLPGDDEENDGGDSATGDRVQ